MTARQPKKKKRAPDYLAAPGNRWQLWPDVPFVFHNNGDDQVERIAIPNADREVIDVIYRPLSRVTVPALEDYRGPSSVKHEDMSKEWRKSGRK